MEPRIKPPSSLRLLTEESLQQKANEECLILSRETILLNGCCFLKDKGEKFYLGKLAVACEAQKQGVGHKLVKFAIDYARQNGKQAIVLQSRVELAEVHTFFRRFGFIQTGTTAHQGFARPTSITMQLDL